MAQSRFFTALGAETSLGVSEEADQQAFSATPRRFLTSPVTVPQAKNIPVIHQAPSTEMAAPIVPPAKTVAQAPRVSEAAKPSKAPVDLKAERLDYNDEKKIVSAHGDVELEQEGRVLTADFVSYDLNSGQADAQGHVKLTEPNGDMHYADKAVLQNQFKDGWAENMRSVLSDESRMSAEKGERENGTKTTMHDASYTACKACVHEDGGESDTPPWQLKAVTVEHDTEAQRIRYEHAWLETFGVPILYMPYFSHADGSVDRKSGFLSPKAGFKSSLGGYLDNSYYWDIAPDQDATIGLIAYSKESPLMYTQWRKRWDDASLTLEGGITYSEYTDSEAGVSRVQDQEVRGHILGDFLWDLDDLWRVGADIQWASDDQYMRQYDFIDEDVLVSDLYAERFSGRNYFGGHLLTFQDVRVREDQVDQPEVLPELVARFEGDPGEVPLIQGSWFIDSSYLGLRRSGGGQDMDRVSLGGGWQRHLVSDLGLLSQLKLSARQDVYHIRDLETATVGSGLSTYASEARFFPQAYAEASYPLVRDSASGVQIHIEPVASVAVAPNIDVTDQIPNEDSQDVQLDANNLFSADRFPGLDRVEDQSHATYGLRSGVYFAEEGEIRSFLGQSYRFSKSDNPFSDGSGLSTRSSDVVGELAALYDDYNFDYRFQLDSRHLNSRRHEVSTSANFGRFSLGAQYIFAKNILSEEFDESREQLSLATGYYLTPEWRVRLGGTQDLGEVPGLRKATMAIDYFGQCLFLSLSGERNLTDDVSGESDLELHFRIGLKNLGEFEKSQWSNAP